MVLILVQIIIAMEKLQAIIEQKDLLLAEKERQIQMLERCITTLQEKS